MSRPATRASSTQQENALQRVRDILRAAFFDHAALKFVSLVLSLTLFILVNIDKEAVIGVTIGVSYTMPENRVLVSEPVDQVRLNIEGPWRRIKRFDEREIDRIHVDLTTAKSGEYRFQPEAIRLPQGLTLVSISPASVPLRFEPVAEKTVEVEVPTSGRPQRGYRVESVIIKPSRVRLRGAESAIASISKIATRELSLRGKSSSFSETLPLVPSRPAPIIQIVDREPITVEVQLTEEVGTRRMEKLAVDIRPGRGELTPQTKSRFQLTPPTVDIVLRGPQAALDALSAEPTPYIDVYPEDVTGEPRSASVQIDKPPEGVAIEVIPRQVTVGLKPSVPNK